MVLKVPSNLDNSILWFCDFYKTIKYAFFVCKFSDFHRNTLFLKVFLCVLFLFSCLDLSSSQWWLFLSLCVRVHVCLWAQCHIWSLSPHACLTADQVLKVSVTDRFSLQFTANITEGEGREKTVHKMYEETCREDAGISAQTECLLSLGQNDSLAQSPRRSK